MVEFRLQSCTKCKRVRNRRYDSDLIVNLMLLKGKDNNCYVPPNPAVHHKQCLPAIKIILVSLNLEPNAQPSRMTSIYPHA